MLNINGQIFYEFEDLVVRSGLQVAEKVFDDIADSSGHLINVETGDATDVGPFPIGRDCIFDEVGWADLCSHADEISARSRRPQSFASLLGFQGRR